MTSTQTFHVQYEMQFVFFIFFSSLACTFVSSKVKKPSFSPYCLSRNLCKPACNCTPAPGCIPLEMNEDFRREITSYMNQIRQVQTKGEPQPSGLTMLEYDEELEEISSCWASKCENEYSECFFTPRFSSTSQNVGVLSRKEPSMNLWYEVISNWLGEIKTLNVEMLLSLPEGEKGQKIHNFAQLLSEKVCYVGCSWSISPQWVFLVCTFGPRGPVQGQPIYKTGIPCSSCPPSYECTQSEPYERLCKRRNLRSASSRVSPQPKIPIPLPHQTLLRAGVKHEKRKKSIRTNINHPWAGIYIMLILLLGAVVILFVLGFAFYCICFY